MFTLVMSRSKVNEYAYRDFCQTHIVPQLLALGCPQGIHGLTFNDNVLLTEEINIVLVLKRVSVKIHGEIVFLLKGDTSFFEDDGQSFLIHILVQERAECAMDFVKCAVQVITILTQLAAKFRINIVKPFDGITHGTFFIETFDEGGLLSIVYVFVLKFTKPLKVPLMKTKTEKTPHVMAEAYGLTYCPSALVPESKLSHRSNQPSQRQKHRSASLH